MSIGPERGVGHVESHLTGKTDWLKRPERPCQEDTLSLWSWARPTRFMTMVIIHQAEHLSIVLEMTGTIIDHTFSIWIDSSATKRFIQVHCQGEIK
jgi:hypothetical protein